MSKSHRLHTGIPELDQLLGGGLIPGTLTVVLGATGIGKSQLGLQFAAEGKNQEGERGVLFDMTSRGDSQNHQDYAERLFGWNLRPFPAETRFDPESVWNRDAVRSDAIHLFERSGRRVTKSDLEQEDWREWKVELARKLETAIAFFYGNFVHGVRRCVIDGIEPTDRASDSFQFHLFDYIYHQILRKDHDWVARDLLRVQYRANEGRVATHAYDSNDVGCLLLATTHEVMLDDLLERPIQSGDLLSNANTVILMGKVRGKGAMTRALHVAKHRGSACDESIVPYRITEHGIVIER
ncbi:MAG: RAD55 family ATPase [Planctomycetaceae bacterium]